MRHRHGEHKCIRIDTATWKLHHPGNRDRQDKDVDRQQVKREQPRSLSQMRLVHIFDNRNLELAR